MHEGACQCIVYLISRVSGAAIVGTHGYLSNKNILFARIFGEEILGRLGSMNRLFEDFFFKKFWGGNLRECLRLLRVICKRYSGGCSEGSLQALRGKTMLVACKTTASL